jgi:hypothetical protein
VTTQVKDCDLRLRPATQPSYSDFGRETRPQIGETVEVRSAEEILATLDSEGKLENVPFMPEMLAFCGGRFQVFKHADHTCTDGEPRCLKNTVHLDELRCDGSAHRNCQAKCLMFWKEAWLKRIAPEHRSGGIREVGRTLSNSIQNEILRSNITARNSATAFLSAHVERNDGTIRCQATEIRNASCPLDGTLPQYFGDVCRDFWAQRIGWPELSQLMTWIRQKMIWLAFVWWARAPWNAKRYNRTPARSLDLQAGDLVKVRSTWQILRTLDGRGRNRGLRFTPEMFRYCGRKYRVLSRLERRIDETGGQLIEFGNGCVLLENVVCKGQRTFCSRTEYHYWREIWLERTG